MKISIFVGLLLIQVSNLASETIEFITPNEAFVGDLLIYKISTKDVSSITIPEGEFSLGNDLPIYKIYDKKAEPEFSTAKVIFFKPGNYTLPITWEYMGKTETSQLQIKIKLRLSGSESEPEDIEPPLSFRGAILIRLILLILFFLFNLYILYALYLYFKNKTKIVDAYWNTIPNLSEEEKSDLILKHLFSQEEVTLKDFSFTISEVLKRHYSSLLNMRLFHLTDTELFKEVQNRTHLNPQDLEDIRDYLIQSKYRESNLKITESDAKDIWKNIKDKLNL
ncbi:MAG: hypothetical protein O9301_11845 [Leptospira sp.]|nr:hypothetical protein [Leptospira sp.]